MLLGISSGRIASPVRIPRTPATNVALLFASSLPPGVHHHTVFVRALSSGQFIMPAAHAEAMYAPEVNGRTRSARVQIATRP